VFVLSCCGCGTDIRLYNCSRRRYRPKPQRSRDRVCIGFFFCPGKQRQYNIITTTMTMTLCVISRTILFGHDPCSRSRIHLDTPFVSILLLLLLCYSRSRRLPQTTCTYDIHERRKGVHNINIGLNIKNRPTVTFSNHSCPPFLCRYMYKLYY